MSRRQKYPLRVLTKEEQKELVRISRANSESARCVARAKASLAVLQGQSDASAARVSGPRPGDAVATLVERFNTEGLAALTPRHGGELN